MTVLIQKIQDTFSGVFSGLITKVGLPKVMPQNGVGKHAPKTSHMRLSSKWRMSFYDQMFTLIDSGVTLIDSLSLIRAQEKNPHLKSLHSDMIRHVSGGLSFSDAMNLFPHVFPDMQVALIRAGEKSGNLRLVLAELVDEMEASDDFMRKLTGAMFYPIILIVLALVLVTGMMTLVIPKIAAMYEESRVDLPRLTQAVIDISNFMVAHWKGLFLMIFVAVAGLIFFFTKVTFGRLLWEKILFALPLVGKLNKEKNIMILTSNMGMLMKSGVLISDAFAITEGTIKNLHYRYELSRIRQGVVMGREVSSMMGLEDIREQKFVHNPYFPLQTAQLIHIGESTGTIPKMLYKIRDNYRKNIQYVLKNLSTIIEPLMIMIVAVFVGTILLAVMLPFFYIGTTIS